VKHVMRYLFISIMLVLMLPSTPTAAVQLNDDGRQLIAEAAEAYARDIRERPFVEDERVTNYLQGVADRLLKGKALPDGVSVTVAVIEASNPDLHSYADGHIVMTTGMLYAMRNEAQLAAVLSHEVAHIVEGYYIDLYQQIKKAERKKRSTAIVGALVGGLMDVAVDTAAQYREIEETEKLMRGEATYGETMKKMAIIEGGRSGYHSMREVVDSIPPEDNEGHTIDPRFRFEPVADAHGMQYLAQAGYDVGEASVAWSNVAKLRNRQLEEREAVLGGMARQLSQMQSMATMQNEQVMRQAGMSSGLAQTISVAPRGRAEFVDSLKNMKEVREADSANDRGVKPFQQFLNRTLLAKANRAMEDERYGQAYEQYLAIHEAGIRNTAVSYGLAKSRLGDFAFGASEKDKRASEKQYREAIGLDRSYAPAWKGLGELYEDWERYEDAVSAYTSYRKLAPKSEQKRLARKIKVLSKRASR
jgi:hypothetical protein